MTIFLILLLLALNGAISFWNAKVCGEAWAEAKVLGGFIFLVVWSGAIQSAIGFSMIYIFVMAGAGYVTGFLSDKSIEALLSLWYLAVIVPALGTGLIITVHSWIAAYRERSLLNMGTAAYNTFAQAHNMYSAVDGIGQSLSKVTDFFSSDDSDSDDFLKGVVILLVIVALAAGILTTYSIIRIYAGTLPLPKASSVPVGRRRYA
jgi:hypothetical protein